MSRFLPRATYERLIHRLAGRLGMSPDELMRSRKAPHAAARQRLWTALHELGVSGPEIARAAGMDNSTIHHGVSQWPQLEQSFIDDVQSWLQTADRRQQLIDRMARLAREMTTTTTELQALEEA